MNLELDNEYHFPVTRDEARGTDNENYSYEEWLAVLVQEYYNGYRLLTMTTPVTIDLDKMSREETMFVVGYVEALTEKEKAEDLPISQTINEYFYTVGEFIEEVKDGKHEGLTVPITFET